MKKDNETNRLKVIGYGSFRGQEKYCDLIRETKTMIITNFVGYGVYGGRFRKSDGYPIGHINVRSGWRLNSTNR